MLLNQELTEHLPNASDCEMLAENWNNPRWRVGLSLGLFPDLHNKGSVTIETGSLINVYSDSSYTSKEIQIPLKDLPLNSVRGVWISDDLWNDGNKSLDDWFVVIQEDVKLIATLTPGVGCDHIDGGYQNWYPHEATKPLPDTDDEETIYWRESRYTYSIV